MKKSNNNKSNDKSNNNTTNISLDEVFNVIGSLKLDLSISQKKYNQLVQAIQDPKFLEDQLEFIKSKKDKEVEKDVPQSD